ncbi:hypothetical protein AMECASPLE_023200 [Ameca splendens]|uniref:Uncharacterized protein n=1 Tax=Ameca splendens TaxID=208324 RepID=A0ABV0XH37_9TELE
MGAFPNIFGSLDIICKRVGTWIRPNPEATKRMELDGRYNKNKDNGASGVEHFDENVTFKKVIYVDDKRSTFIWPKVNISEFKKNFCQQKFRLSSFLNTSKCVIICFSKMVFHQA